MLYLGCSQWSYHFWRGNLYPPNLKAKDYLEYYSHRFNTVELNSTFYDLLDEKNIRQWISKVNTPFRFCPKFPKEISHVKNLSHVEKLTEEFINSVKMFGDNLGACFLQLPLSLGPSQIYLIDELLTFINDRIKVSVEIRITWLFRPEILNECLAVLKNYKAGTVIVDSVDTIKYLNNIKLTNDTAFIRFLAYNHETDFSRINDWIKLIKYWKSRELKDVYFMVHLPESVSEPEILRYIESQFEKSLGFEVKRWQLL